MEIVHVLWCLQHHASATSRSACLHHELMIAQGRFAGVECRVVDAAVTSLSEVS